VWVEGAVVQITNVTPGETVSKPICAMPAESFGKIEELEEHVGAFECRDILLESGNCISVVETHCFMPDSGKWIPVQNLTSGLRLKTHNGTVGIKSVTTRTTAYTGKVYNLKIEGSDQYMIGDDAVIVRDY
jgi:hypothetical protein